MKIRRAPSVEFELSWVSMGFLEVYIRQLAGVSRSVRFRRPTARKRQTYGRYCLYGVLTNVINE